MPDLDDAALEEAVTLASRAVNGPLSYQEATGCDLRVQLATMVLVLVPEVRRLREECEGRGRMFTMVTDRLQECVTRHDLGLGGERVDELVCDEVDRLAVEGESKDVTIAQLESALATARAELARVQGMLHEVEARTDPAGEVRERVCAAETARALALENEELRAELARVSDERDGLKAQLSDFAGLVAAHTAPPQPPAMLTTTADGAGWGPADLDSMPKGWHRPQLVHMACSGCRRLIWYDAVNCIGYEDVGQTIHVCAANAWHGTPCR